jgi:hypothetical protein
MHANRDDHHPTVSIVQQTCSSSLGKFMLLHLRRRAIWMCEAAAPRKLVVAVSISMNPSRAGNIRTIELPLPQDGVDIVLSD